jgi:hypothetical protein
MTVFTEKQTRLFGQVIGGPLSEAPTIDAAVICGSNP